MSFVFPNACVDPILDALSLKDIVVLYCTNKKAQTYLDIRYSGMITYTLNRLDDLSEEDVLYISVVFDFSDKLGSMLSTLSIDTVMSTCRHIISLERLDTLKSLSRPKEVMTFRYGSWRFCDLLRYAVSSNMWSMVCYICSVVPCEAKVQAYSIVYNEAMGYKNIQMLKNLVTSGMYDRNNESMLIALVMINDNNIFDTHSTELFYVCNGYCTSTNNWEIVNDLIAASIGNDHITDKIMEFAHTHAPNDVAVRLQRFVDRKRTV